MTLSHLTGQFNVHGSFAVWLNARLLASLPASTPTATLNVDHPAQPLTPPQWSVHFLGFTSGAGYTGGHVAGGLVGDVRYDIAQVDCWVSRRAAAWRKQRAQMADAVTKAVTDLKATGSSLPIYDFYGNEAAPADTGYRIVIDRVEARDTAPDPNPDIERQRLLVYFHWTERNN